MSTESTKSRAIKSRSVKSRSPEAAAAIGLGRGERAPDFVLPTIAGAPTRLYGIAGGRPTVLLFSPTWDAVAPAVQALEARESAFVVVVLRAAPPAVRPSASLTFLDIKDRIRSAYRLPGNADTYALLLSANLRTIDIYQLADVESLIRAIELTVSDLSSITDQQIIRMQAPVLMITDLLHEALCRELIEQWESEHTETGVEESTTQGRNEVLDHRNKRRQDHVVGDGNLLSRLTTAIGRRVFPELVKAFAYRPDRFEGFKIACYEAPSAKQEGGFFLPHRDNLSPSTAHRRFALSLNLSDDFEGGELRFPEYGADLYRPERGAAVVFSCSHLHEALQVTAGRRFALLSFMFSGTEAKDRRR